MKRHTTSPATPDGRGLNQREVESGKSLRQFGIALPETGNTLWSENHYHQGA
jgi:hypothetical protein